MRCMSSLGQPGGFLGEYDSWEAINQLIVVSVPGLTPIPSGKKVGNLPVAQVRNFVVV